MLSVNVHQTPPGARTPWRVGSCVLARLGLGSLRFPLRAAGSVPVRLAVASSPLFLTLGVRSCLLRSTAYHRLQPYTDTRTPATVLD